MNDDQWADAIDKMVTGLEQYNASIHALGKKSNNDTQPLGYQVPEELPYQAYDKPVEEQPAFLWKGFQQAKEAWEASLRKRAEEDVKYLSPEQGPTLEEFDQRIKHDLERRIRELQSKGQADFSTVEEKRAYLEKWGRVAEQQYKQEEPEQPLLIDDPLQTEEQMAQAQKTWDELKKHPLVQTLTQRYQEAQEHIHGPFAFLMNQNHNALRGCVTCGATWVGLMAGAASGLVWHPVGELMEEEDE